MLHAQFVWREMDDAEIYVSDLCSDHSPRCSSSLLFSCLIIPSVKSTKPRSIHGAVGDLHVHLQRPRSHIQIVCNLFRYGIAERAEPSTGPFCSEAVAAGPVQLQIKALHEVSDYSLISGRNTLNFAYNLSIPFALVHQERLSFSNS